MGAWGPDTFDNDIAGDWAGECGNADDLSYVEETIDEVLEIGDDYLESDEASGALAACEVIARLKGNWGVRNAYTEDVDAWVEAHPQVPADELVSKALAAIDRIRTGESELRDLWEEGDAGEWHAAVADLRRRVAG